MGKHVLLERPFFDGKAFLPAGEAVLPDEVPLPKGAKLLENPASSAAGPVEEKTPAPPAGEKTPALPPIKK